MLKACSMRCARIASLQLALDGSLVGEKEVLGHLLGDGRGADDLALAGHLHLDIADSPRGNARPVEAGML